MVKQTERFIYKNPEELTFDQKELILAYFGDL
jgi:hypothetical protein